MLKEHKEKERLTYLMLMTRSSVVLGTDKAHTRSHSGTSGPNVLLNIV